MHCIHACLDIFPCLFSAQLSFPGRLWWAEADDITGDSSAVLGTWCELDVGQR